MAAGYVTLANNIVPANAASPHPLRKSAGLTEFYRQTGIDLINIERGPGAAAADQERRWYALQFYPIAKLGGKDLDGKFLYIHPEDSIGGIFYVKYDDTWYMVIHNGKMTATGSSAWLGGSGLALDNGKWNVYKNTDYSGWSYDNTGGKPFGTISD
jgi:hypothetical protein